MILYLAVTGDEYELPLFVTTSDKEMAEWAGIKLTSLRSSVSRNKNKPPLPPDGTTCKFRLRKITIEEDAQ